MELNDIEPVGWWVILLAIAEVGLLLFGVIFALYKSADLPSPALLVIAVSLITVVILTIYVLTSESDVLTLAGVPIGALVTAATGTFKDSNAEAQNTMASIQQMIAAAQQEAAANMVVQVADAQQQQEEVKDDGHAGT